MSTTIAICNQKGGTGKTTTAGILTTRLTDLGYKVLAVDIDPQSNLTISKGIANAEKTILGVLLKEADIKDTILQTKTGDLVPASNMLAIVPTALSEVTGKEYRLKEALEGMDGDYDFIIIDCPPALNTLSINSLVCADKVIVPINCDGYSLQGLDQLTETIEDIRKYFNPKLEILGVLLTKYDYRTRITKEVSEIIERLAKNFGTQVFKTKIRRTTKADELQFRNEGLFRYAPKSNLAEDYSEWVDELLKALGQKRSKGRKNQKV